MWVAPGGTDGVAVGWSVNGTGPSALRLRGGAWIPEATPQYMSAAGLAQEALGETWAVGCDAYHHVGGSWVEKSLPTFWCVNSISLVPGRGGWVVGPFGEILLYNPLRQGQRFYDVLPDNPFYTYIEYMATHNIVSGYADNTFRPNNTTTRAQLTKIVALAEGWTLVNPTNPTFSDVPRDHPFYTFIETAYSHGVIAGYDDGTFRPGNDVTRGQLSKIVVVAEGWEINTSGGPHFTDVPTTHPFYSFVETAYNRAIISGYADNTFRPGNNATRGQISKIVYLAIQSP
jgi:hypothetical protein